MADLDRCPKCAGRQVRALLVDSTYRAQCDCGISYIPYATTVDELVRLWNNRPIKEVEKIEQRTTGASQNG